MALTYRISLAAVVAAACALGCGDDGGGAGYSGGAGASGAPEGDSSGTGAVHSGSGGATDEDGGSPDSVGGARGETGSVPGETGGSATDGGASTSSGGGLNGETGGSHAATGGAASEGGAGSGSTAGLPSATGGSQNHTGGSSSSPSGGASSDGGAGGASVSGASGAAGGESANGGAGGGGTAVPGGAAGAEFAGAAGHDAATVEPSLYVGVRSSEYGPVGDFPSAERWEEMASSYAARMPDAAPALVWIVGTIGENGDCNLEFPSPGGDHARIGFQDEDKHEAFLNHFDSSGVSVWLQIEPGDAAVSTLIDVVLGQYGHHPSVKGFGVDVEWYQDSQYPGEGKAVTDEEASAWVQQVRGYDPHYTLFLKHWSQDQMPPTERDGLFFVDDSQGVEMNELVAEFADWGEQFAPAPVGFQYGYEADRSWWSSLDDPPRDLGQAILDAVPNTYGLFWVDFTMDQVF